MTQDAPPGDGGRGCAGIALILTAALIIFAVLYPLANCTGGTQ